MEKGEKSEHIFTVKVKDKDKIISEERNYRTVESRTKYIG